MACSLKVLKKPIFSSVLAIGFGFFTVNINLFGSPALLEHRWKERIIVLNGPDSKWLQDEYAELIRDSKALIERDVVIYDCRFKSCKRGSFNTDGALKWQKNAARFTQHQASIILIGKDGGIKKIWNGGSVRRNLIQVIDGMPMRQQEMRQ